MCVVDPSRDGEEALEEALLAEALDELRRALGLRGFHRLDRPRCSGGGAGPRSSSASE